MTVGQYQRIYEIQETTLDNIERLALIICFLFDKSAQEVDDMPSKKFLKYADRVQKELIIKDQPGVELEIDATKITLGQFIECQHWLKSDPIEVIHLIAASIKEGIKNHTEDAELFIKSNIGLIYNQVSLFVQSFHDLISSYKGLFGDQDQNDTDKPHVFIEQYGWIFSAKQVAEHEGINLDQAFDLPIIQALNDLAYLKSKQAYDRYLMKK